MKKIISKNFEETRELGKKSARNFQGGEIICLAGDLGSGKTTFTQGILEELGAQKPYTSPTFLIMKEYNLKTSNQKSKIKKIYHIDTYRVVEKDILDLGWKEMIGNPENVIIIEWPERIKNIVPESACWFNFRWLGENEREILFNVKY